MAYFSTLSTRAYLDYISDFGKAPPHTRGSCFFGCYDAAILAPALPCTGLDRSRSSGLRPRSARALRRWKTATFWSHRIFGGRPSAAKNSHLCSCFLRSL